MNPNLRSLLCLLLTACGPGFVAGNGTVTTSTREVSAFRKISVASAVLARVHAGTRAVSLRTDENLQSLMEVVVEGDTLFIREKSPGVRSFNPTLMEADITNDVLEGVEASGASQVVGAATPVTSFPLTASGASTITLTDLSSTDFTLTATGASTVTLGGAATRATINAEGASTVDVRGVPLSALSVDASGASTVKARVSATLDGSVSGASLLSVTGTPTAQVVNSGASTVTLGAP
jgi:hypothetical protein